jgi:hypothetical protein
MLKKLFEKKSSITLNEALELKERIQTKLKSNHAVLKSENSVIQGQIRTENLKKLVKESEQLTENLIVLKLKIQEANLKVIEGETKCLSNYVYHLSEIKTQITNLISIRTNVKEGAHKSDKGTVVTYGKPVYSRVEIEDWINKLKKEQWTIENKLTSLNSKITVEIPFKTNML